MPLIETQDAFTLFVSDELVPQPVPNQSEIVKLPFSGLLDPPLRLQTNVSQCGGQLWPAGMVLADYLIRHNLEALRGKTIIELGAGSGLVGLAIALRLRQTALPAGVTTSAMPTRIDLTDGLDALVPMLQQNISLNFPPEDSSNISIASHQFSWGERPNSALPLEPDVVLAADCSYLEQSFRPLLMTLTDLMGPETVLWFCYKKRRRRDRDFLKMLSKAFNVLAVSGDWERDDTWLFQVRRSDKKSRVGELSAPR